MISHQVVCEKFANTLLKSSLEKSKVNKQSKSHGKSQSQIKDRKGIEKKRNVTTKSQRDI